MVRRKVIRLSAAVVVIFAPVCAHAGDSSSAARGRKLLHPSSAGFGKMTDLSFSKSDAASPLLQRSASHGHVEVMVVHGQPQFSAAPLPDDDIQAPTEGESEEAGLRPDFFHRDAHQVGEALANGAGVNSQRAGHGSVSAGVALAVPME